MNKIKPIVRYSPEWEREAIQIMKDFSPKIYACLKCNHPVADGYCCTFCGDTNPSHPKTIESEK